MNVYQALLIRSNLSPAIVAFGAGGATVQKAFTLLLQTLSRKASVHMESRNIDIVNANEFMESSSASGGWYV